MGFGRPRLQVSRQALLGAGVVQIVEVAHSRHHSLTGLRTPKSSSLYYPARGAVGVGGRGADRMQARERERERKKERERERKIERLKERQRERERETDRRQAWHWAEACFRARRRLFVHIHSRRWSHRIQSSPQVDEAVGGRMSVD